MKKYFAPEAELIVLAADVIMASDENETPKDYVDGENLVISDIANI